LFYILLASRPLLILAREFVSRSGYSPEVFCFYYSYYYVYCTGLELEQMGQNTITGKQMGQNTITGKQMGQNTITGKQMLGVTFHLR